MPHYIAHGSTGFGRDQECEPQTQVRKVLRRYKCADRRCLSLNKWICVRNRVPLPMAACAQHMIRLLRFRTLNWAVDDVNLQDFFYPILGVSSSGPEGAAIAWDFFKSNFEKVRMHAITKGGLSNATETSLVLSWCRSKLKWGMDNLR